MGLPETRSAPDLSAIIVAFNSGPGLARCLDSVRREARREGITAELVVVDNASGDGGVDHLDRGDVIVLRNAENLGFGRAVNRGVQAATGRRLLLLNPDARLAPGALGPLLAALDADPTVALAAPTLRLANGSPQESPRRFYDLPALLAQRTPFRRTTQGRAARARHLMAGYDRLAPVDVDWVTGAAMLLARDALPAQGPFDERYFLYFEDVDLCRRLGASGRTVRFVPESVVEHDFGRGSRRQSLRNPLLWRHLWSGLLYATRWSAARHRGRAWSALGTRGGRALGRSAILGGAGLLLGAAFVPAPAALLGLAVVLGLLALPSRRAPVVGSAPRPSLLGSAGALLLAGLASLGLATTLDLGSFPTRTPALDLPSLPAVALWALLGALALDLLGRLAARGTAALRGAGLLHRTCLIAGTPDEAQALTDALREQPMEGLTVLGFVPLDGRAGPAPRCGSWSDVVATSERLRADTVLIAGPPEALARMAKEVVALREAGVSASFVLTGAHELLQAEAPHTLAGFPVLPLGPGPDAPALRRLRDTVDRCVAAFALLAITPILGAITALTRLRYGRSFVAAPRVGLAGADFSMWRFCTGDPERSTGLGATLRRLHLDELPQLLHVVRGEMSLVGPRPVERAVWDRLEPWEQARCVVRPGITGMWQLDRLRRWRLEQMIVSDLLYLLRWSPGLDLRILARTLLGRRG